MATVEILNADKKPRQDTEMWVFTVNVDGQVGYFTAGFPLGTSEERARRAVVTALEDNPGDLEGSV
ncbi:hypothetical protein [Rhizobacter sp. Root1221]|uniref:hypothetical protein n=1 Tax=Rhizobacter sp. Root1221 TaxID=1736433 RepID=UPI001F1AF2CB|nr:hypothetical protein [Rhizobacter sp. Root1221]